MIHQTIIAHGNGIAAFRRHLPLWKDHHPDVGLVLCPTNDTIPQTESPWPVVTVELAAHHGPPALIRLRWLLEHLADQSSISHYIIHEYDSFCLYPDFRYQSGLVGNLFRNRDPEDFIAPRYPNPPWTLDRRSLLLMLRASRKWPDVTEDGYADRYFAALAHLANVPILSHQPLGFARATITEDNISELRKAIYAGATMIHGIKQKWTLEAALQFFDERPRPAS